MYNKIETIENIRPIVLLNIIRNRIRPLMDGYVSVNQSGFQPNRSTADAVASFKWQMAITQKYDENSSYLELTLKSHSTELVEKTL